MQKIIAEITMSVDGFIAGAGISSKLPMGANGEKLHEWIFAKATAADKKWIEDIIQSTGAVITGNHTYATAIEDAWGGASPFNAPAFVVCHSVPSKKVKGFVFITGGIHEALKQAKEAAGKKNVWIMGGANIIQQYLESGLVDELRLHVAPMLLIKGTRLFDNIAADSFELIKESVTETEGAVHLVFRIKQ